MQTTTLPKIDLKNSINRGAECRVYPTDDDTVVFKLYNQFREYKLDEVQRIIELNREYAERGLAPQVYSDVIEIDGGYGYYTERVLPVEQVPVEFNSIDALAYLIDELDIDNNYACELAGNWGLTKDKRPVLLDFGLLTLYTLEIIEEEPRRNG